MERATKKRQGNDLLPRFFNARFPWHHPSSPFTVNPSNWGEDPFLPHYVVFWVKTMRSWGG